MTHQEIATELKELNRATEEFRKAIDANHKAALVPIREKCEAIGHIFILSLRFSILSGPEQSSYACAVCGTWRAKEQERAAA